jgi:hypothetical protein
MDEARFAFQTCELRRPRPDQSMDAVTQIGVHAPLQVRGGEAQIHEAWHGIRTLQQCYCNGRSWSEPSRLREFGPPNRGQGFASGGCRLRDRVHTAASSQLTEANAFDIAHQGKRRKILKPARLRMDHFGHRHRSPDQPHQVNFFLA